MTRIQIGPSKRALWEAYIEGVIAACHHMLHGVPPTGQSEGRHADILDAVERLGWRHARENRAVFYHEFSPGSITVEADQFERRASA